MSVSTGARVSALASFLLVGACLSGEDSAGQVELGNGNDNPADTSPDGNAGGGGGGEQGGGGGAGNINVNARFQVRRLTTDDQAFQTAAFEDKLLDDVWGLTTLSKEQGATKAAGTFLNVAQTTGLLIEIEQNGRPTGTRIMLDKAITGITNNESDRIQIQANAKKGQSTCGRAAVLVASQFGVLWAANPEVSTTEGVKLIDLSSKGKDHPQFTGVALVPELKNVKGNYGDDGGGGTDGGNQGTPGGCACSNGGHNGGNNLRQTILMPDFHNRRVLAFDDSFHQINLGDRFQIPGLDKMKEAFSPFGIRAFKDMVVITAAVRRGPEKGEPQIDQQVAGNGKGIVAAFKLDGTLLWSTNQLAKGQEQPREFDVPWGLEMGGITLCATGSALLVSEHGLDTQLDGKGNESGGTITVLDPRTGKVIGQLMDGTKNGKEQPVRVQGIWGLSFGANIKGMRQDLVHFGAGPAQEDGHKGQARVQHGLFGRLDRMAAHKDE